MAKRKKRDNMLQDGQVGRVRMTMRDAAAWRDPAGPLHVFAGDGRETGMRRQGFRTLHPASPVAIEANQARNAAYRWYDEQVTSAYKNKPPTGVGEHGSRDQQEGDLCTINGAPGHLRNLNGELTCVADPDAATSDGMDHQTRMSKIYDAYDHNLQARWRGGNQ